MKRSFDKLDERRIAYDILLKIQQGGYSNIVLNQSLKGSGHGESAFVKRLVMGVVENLLFLDHTVSQYCSKPLKKLDEQVLVVLRMGAYQILFLDKVPDSAACNEAVKLTKAVKKASAAGMVNAVLRKISQYKSKILDERDALPPGIRFSVADWIYPLLNDSYGQAEEILTALTQPQTPLIRINTCMTARDKLLVELQKQGHHAECVEQEENALRLYADFDITAELLYQAGHYHIQSLASQLAVKALELHEGAVLVDACAAPGGKTFTAAQAVGRKGRVYALDIHENRVNLIKQGAKRLKLNQVQALTCDSSLEYNGIVQEKVTYVLCDVPCSGLGVLSKKPELRYKGRGEFDALPEKQYAILCASARYLQSGGVLLYSTCTLNPAENELVTERFLAAHSDFEPFPLGDCLGVGAFRTDDYQLTLLPHIHHTDGFFIARMRKR